MALNFLLGRYLLSIKAVCFKLAVTIWLRYLTYVFVYLGDYVLTHIF